MCYIAILSPSQDVRIDTENCFGARYTFAGRITRNVYIITAAVAVLLLSSGWVVSNSPILIGKLPLYTLLQPPSQQQKRYRVSQLVQWELFLIAIPSSYSHMELGAGTAKRARSAREEERLPRQVQGREGCGAMAYQGENERANVNTRGKWHQLLQHTLQWMPKTKATPIFELKESHTVIMPCMW